MIEEQLEEIHSHFARSHIRLKRQWLREVLGYLHTIQINGYSLINLVYHQWLYTDIGESTELQQRLISRHGQEQQSLKQLPEASIFQIQSVLDIGTARQKQYKKLTPDYDEFTTEIGVNGFGDFNLQKVSKCFCIQVSDGQGQLKAFEKERVPQLTLSTCPGSKILIYGGTRMERGVLFLKPNNCQLLGGAVKRLMQTKHILKLLAPQAPPPAISRPANAVTAPIPAAQPQDRRQPVPDGRALAIDRPSNAATPPAPTIPQPKRQLVIPERTSSAIINKRPSSNAATTAPVSFARPQPQFVPDGRAAATIISRPTNTATPPVAVAAAQPPQIGGHRLVSERHVRAYRQLNVTPLASVVKKLQFTVGCKQFTVIAFVQEFTSTFRIVDGKWAMSVALVDDSRQRLECSMAHELLLSLISMTPKEAMEIKSCGSEQRKKEGAKRLELMQEQLRRLDLIFGIEGMPGMKPVVLRVQTLADQLGIV